jgi:hypothetical protein
VRGTKRNGAGHRQPNDRLSSPEAPHLTAATALSA